MYCCRGQCACDSQHHVCMWLCVTFFLCSPLLHFSKDRLAQTHSTCKRGLKKLLELSQHCQRHDVRYITPVSPPTTTTKNNIKWANGLILISMITGRTRLNDTKAILSFWKYLLLFHLGWSRHWRDSRSRENLDRKWFIFFYLELEN